MINTTKAFWFGAAVGLISVFLIFFAVINLLQAKDELLSSIESLKIDPASFENSIRSPTPSTNEQITEARRSIQRASSRIRNLKITIFNHAGRASAQRSLDDARTFLVDIVDNAGKVAQAHEQLESELFDLVELYNRKIEEIYQNQTGSQSKRAGYGLSFWVGILGILGAISTMLLAWRKDHREVRELEIEVRRLKLEINEN